jgi:hypothetical protein
MNVETGLSEIDGECINWSEVFHDRINTRHFVVNIMTFLSENTKFSVLITNECLSATYEKPHTKDARIFQNYNSHPKILSATKLTKQVLHRGPTRHKHYGGGSGGGIYLPGRLEKISVRKTKQTG